MLGDVPFLNVDVNHKAFPKRYNSFIDLIKDIAQDQRQNADVSRGLDERMQNSIHRHLSGLDVMYTKPGTNPMIYKYLALVRNPAQETFTLADGKSSSIAKYFQDNKVQIKYPNLPCVKMGSTVKSITVPMEFCSIPDSQVNQIMN